MPTHIMASNATLWLNRRRPAQIAGGTTLQEKRSRLDGWRANLEMRSWAHGHAHASSHGTWHMDMDMDMDTHMPRPR
eukprot:849625-Prymnesium_polylepis.3